MTINVLLADEHPITRRGITMLLEATDDMTVANEVANSDELRTELQLGNWDLLLLDLTIPGCNGLELIRQIKEDYPKLPILIFSAQPEHRYAVRAMRSGASGYLTKGSEVEQLLNAMRKVAGGGMYVSPRTAELLVADYAKPADKLPHTLLSRREFEIFTEISEGKRLFQIASEHSLSIKTVSTHKKHIFKKLNVSNQVDLVRYAMQHQLLDHHEY